MFLRNNVFPRDAVNPKGKFYPIFGSGAACAEGSLVGDVPVKLMCPVSLAPAVCMQRARVLAGFLKLAVSPMGGLRDCIALSCGGFVGFAQVVVKQGWLQLLRGPGWDSPAWLFQNKCEKAKCNGGALCPVLASSSRMVCRKPIGLLVG
jgi:hypothetical protein